MWALWRTPANATTICFMTLALAQVFHLITARSITASDRRYPRAKNPYAIAAAGLAVGLQLLAVYLTPLASVLQVSPLGPGDWLSIVGFAATPVLAAQGLRLARRRAGKSR